ncbi:MAG: glycoside hydrolase family 127 protein, partial [Clostridia bacterium]|nr:glycoside hydrolase family 127 protein [Clostridia bacterium]
ATGDPGYRAAAKGIYDYVRSRSSSFGWVPEYAQWHPMTEEHCETCCVRDMIICARELTKCGYDDYWNDINLFARNMLIENQVRYTGYVTVDNTLPDGSGITYRDIDKRMIGGFTGGSEPNSISLSRFRSIAGCCVGTAPTALKTVWDSVVTEENGVYIVNIPCDKETDTLKLVSDLPNRGRVTVTAKKDCTAAFRLYGWMGKSPVFSVNGSALKSDLCGGSVSAELKTGDVFEFSFPLRTRRVKETARGTGFRVVWRGCDVVDILPRGEHVRLFQRDLSKPKYYPLPEDVTYTGAANYGPTQQSAAKQK